MEYSFSIDDVIDALKQSHNLVDAAIIIYGDGSKKYRKRLFSFCKRHIENYRSYLLVGKTKDDSPRYCKFCGKEITGDYRKKFCNRSCSASYNNMGKKRSEESKLKTSRALQRRNPNFNGVYHEPRANRNSHRDKPFDSRKEYYCLNCGKKLENPSAAKRNLYCSHKCQQEHKFKEWVEKWKSGEISGTVNNGFNCSDRVKRYLLIKNDYKCEKCGYSGENPYTHTTILQVHHIDGDSSNNREENLQLLCPNCHTMTDNFGSRNKNATVGRSKYFGRIKAKDKEE